MNTKSSSLWAGASFLLLTALAASPAIPPITFRTPPTFPVGDGPAHIIAADLNGDGAADVVTANFDDSTVSVLLGSAAGGFAPASSIAVGVSPSALAAGDLNGDGLLDLVTANANGWNKPGTLSVLLGNGDGTFKAPAETEVGRGPRGVVLGDFNRDGRLDVATAISGGWFETNEVHVLLGKGDGQLEPAVSYGVGLAPAWIASGDFNGDSFPDLVTVNAGPGPNGTTASVLLNQGNGTFAPAVTCGIGAYPGYVDVGDFNGDGKADFITANRASLSVSVVLGRGDGTFDPAITQPVVAGATKLGLADFDGDQRLDAVVLGGTYAAGAVTVLKGKGDGSFMALASLSAGASLDAMAVGEFSGGGHPDLVVAGGYDSAVLLLSGRGDGTFSGVTDAHNVDGPISKLLAADLNRDGRPDLATTHADNDSISVLLQEASGAFLPAVIYPVGDSPRSIKAADLNSDGAQDLVIANFDGTLTLLRGRTTAPGVFTNNWGIAGYSGVLQIGSNHTDVAVADLNQDGKPDLATANYYGSSISVALGQGNGTFQPGAYLLAKAGPTCVLIDDFDVDGQPDIAVGYEGGTAISIFRGNGNGSFEPRQDISSWEIPAFITSADFNGDNKPDLAAGHQDWALVSVLLNTTEGGALSFAAPVTHAVANDPLSLAVGDFNGDNLPDMASANYASVSILLGLGDGNFLTSTNYFNGGYSAACADFDLDGMPDLAVDLGSRVGLFWNDTLPQLQILPAPAGVRIAYPAWKPYTLEASAQLGAAGTWLAVTNVPSVFGSQFVVTDSTDSLARVYRLKRPAR